MSPGRVSPANSSSAAILRSPNETIPRSTFDGEHVGMPLHLVGKALVVSDGDDPKAAVLQLGAESRIFVLLFRGIVMRSVYEDADAGAVLAFVVEVRLYICFP